MVRFQVVYSSFLNIEAPLSSSLELTLWAALRWVTDSPSGGRLLGLTELSKKHPIPSISWFLHLRGKVKGAVSIGFNLDNLPPNYLQGFSEKTAALSALSNTDLTATRPNLTTDEVTAACAPRSPLGFLSWPQAQLLPELNPANMTAFVEIDDNDLLGGSGFAWFYQLAGDNITMVQAFLSPAYAVAAGGLAIPAKDKLFPQDMTITMKDLGMYLQIFNRGCTHKPPRRPHLALTYGLVVRAMEYIPRTISTRLNSKN